MVEADPHRAGRRAPTTDQNPQAAAAPQATGTATEATEGEVMTHPTGPAGSGPGGGAGTGPGRAALASPLAVICIGLALIVAALIAPAAPAPEPVQIRWRPATEQEQRDYDIRQLAAELEEIARQREGATPAPTAVTPRTPNRPTH